MIKIDAHGHSIYSKHVIWGNEAFGTPKQMIKEAIRKDLNGLAITDHNSVKGSLVGLKYTKNLKNFILIPGSEIKCMKGDILALGIKEDIPKKLSVQETIDRIHNLGGLAIAPHPYAGLPRRSSIKDAIRKYRFDAVEVINGGTYPRHNRKAYRVARELKYPILAATDAHYWKDIGTCYTICDCSETVDDVLESIRKGETKIYGRTLNIYSQLRLGTKKVIRSITSRI